MDENWRSLYKCMSVSLLYLGGKARLSVYDTIATHWLKAQMLQEHIVTSLTNLDVYVSL